MKVSHNVFEVLGPELSPDFTNKISTAVVRRSKVLNSIKKEFLGSMRTATKSLTPPCKCERVCVEVTDLFLNDGIMCGTLLVIFEGPDKKYSLKKKIELGHFSGKMYGWFFKTSHLAWNKYPEATFFIPELRERVSFKELFGDTTLGFEIEV